MKTCVAVGLEFLPFWMPMIEHSFQYSGQSKISALLLPVKELLASIGCGNGRTQERYWTLEAEINFVPLSLIEPQFLGSLSHGQLLQELSGRFEQKYYKVCIIFFKDKLFFFFWY